MSKKNGNKWKRGDKIKILARGFLDWLENGKFLEGVRIIQAFHAMQLCACFNGISSFTCHLYFLISRALLSSNFHPPRILSPFVTFVVAFIVAGKFYFSK